MCVDKVWILECVSEINIKSRRKFVIIYILYSFYVHLLVRVVLLFFHLLHISLLSGIRNIPFIYLSIYRFLRSIWKKYGFLPVDSSAMMSLVYTPGVAKVSKKVNQDEKLFEKYVCIQNSSSNSMWIVTDGSAVLGLGNIGHKAAGPVMEGKQALLRWFADVDSNILLVDTSKQWQEGSKEAVANKIIQAVEDIKNRYGNILVMLEDIAAPACFDVEKAINERGMPTIHDDQRGTAIVVVAGVINALKKAGKEKRRYTYCVRF